MIFVKSFFLKPKGKTHYCFFVLYFENSPKVCPADRLSSFMVIAFSPVVLFARQIENKNEPKVSFTAKLSSNFKILSSPNKYNIIDDIRKRGN